MSQLSKLQHIFQDSVLHSDNPLSTTWISASGRATPKTQISIYSFAYQARLKEVLANDFPAMVMAIGDEHFYQIANDYIKSYPSQYFSLRDFGQHMPAFILELIEQNKEYENNHWLYELSLFEWTLGQTFDAADESIFSEHDMAAIPPKAWPDLKFVVHPSVQRLNLQWNTPEMWQALTSDNPSHVTATQEETNAWLFWREDLVTRFRSMQSDEQLAFDKLCEGNNFTEICEALTEVMNEEKVPLCVTGFLKGWITQNLISDVQF